MTEKRRLELAYLTTEYPSLSMTFIQREVSALLAFGHRVEVASINGLSRPVDDLTEVELREHDRTFYVKAVGVAGAARAHLRALRSAPGGYLRGWRLAFRLARFEPIRLLRNIAYLTEAAVVGNWMRDQALDHLHCHLGGSVASVAMFTKEIFGNGSSVTIHGPDEFYDVTGQYLAEKVEHADFVVCISDFARSQMMRGTSYDQWAKFEVRRLGVDPDVFAPRPAPPLGGRFELVCVGRLTPAKGQHILLEAIRALRDRGEDVHATIVGGGTDDGSLRTAARQLGVADLVTFTGPINQDHIRELYAAADAFVLPSFAEGIPIVLMEAMSMEIPVITSRINGIPELIDDGVTGLLTAPSNVDELADAIARLADDPELRIRLGTAGRKAVQDRYDLTANALRLAELFEDRVGGTGVPNASAR